MRGRNSISEIRMITARVRRKKKSERRKNMNSKPRKMISEKKRKEKMCLCFCVCSCVSVCAVGMFECFCVLFFLCLFLRACVCLLACAFPCCSCSRLKNVTPVAAPGPAAGAGDDAAVRAGCSQGGHFPCAEKLHPRGECISLSLYPSLPLERTVTVLLSASRSVPLWPRNGGP